MQGEFRPSHEDIAVELIRALRGRRSQVAFSKRLGYRSNIVQRWEARQCWPAAAVLLRRCKRVGVDVGACYERFYGRRPEWLGERDKGAEAHVAMFLNDLRGKAPIGELAARVGTNRYTVSRWLKGRSQPRLPDFLAMIDASSRRLLDFIAGLVDPVRLPSLAREWTQLESAREAAYATPWSHAVLRALELQGGAPSGGESAWLSRKLGIPRAVAQQALAALHATGQVELRGDRLAPARTGDVDTGRDPRRARELKVRWTETALERLRAGSPGLFGYTVFAISRRDLRRLREIQLQYVRQLQAVIASSQRAQCVGLFCTQLIDLAEGPDNALHGGRAGDDVGIG
jgi:DNA-binding transcriptional regulator YiaG